MGDGQECQNCRKSRQFCECRDATDDVVVAIGEIRKVFREDRDAMIPLMSAQSRVKSEGWRECWTHLMISLAAIGESKIKQKD